MTKKGRCLIRARMWEEENLAFNAMGICPKISISMKGEQEREKMSTWGNGIQ
jgi:hypothetical protein